MIKLTGLWIHENKDGIKSMQGNLAGGRLIVMRNKFKTKDEHPDFNVFLAERSDKKKQEADARTDEYLEPTPIGLSATDE